MISPDALRQLPPPPQARSAEFEELVVVEQVEAARIEEVEGLEEPIEGLEELEALVAGLVEGLALDSELVEVVEGLEGLFEEWK
jgi:hypothetical protein